jgi:predicted membrane channel-forming protein YqfA (hemolysin III family)
MCTIIFSPLVTNKVILYIGLIYNIMCLIGTNTSQATATLYISGLKFVTVGLHVFLFIAGVIIYTQNIPGQNINKMNKVFHMYDDSFVEIPWT